MVARGEEKIIAVRYRREADGTYSVVMVKEWVEIEDLPTPEMARREAAALRLDYLGEAR